MSFENTAKGIENLSQGDISVDELLELLVFATKDVYKINGVKKVSDMRADNPQRLLLRMSSLMKLLLQVYDGNRAALEQFEDEGFREDLEKTADRIGQIKAEFAGVEAQITQTQKKLEEAQQKAEDLRKKLTQAQQQRDKALETVRRLTREAESAQAERDSAKAQAEKTEQNQKQLLEANKELTVLLNALDSLKNDVFVQEKLFDPADAPLAEGRIDSWEALDSWSGAMADRIQGLMTALTTVQKELIRRVERLTDSPEQR